MRAQRGQTGLNATFGARSAETSEGSRSIYARWVSPQHALGEGRYLGAAAASPASPEHPLAMLQLSFIRFLLTVVHP